MRIAVPIFNEQVSPRFDSAKELILFDADNGKVLDKRRLISIELSCSEKIKKLIELQIDTLLCGGIDKKCEHSLESCGIKVNPWLHGDAETLLSEYLINYNKTKKKKIK